MADNINNDNGGGNAVWVTILILVIIALALYFGVFKNKGTTNAPSTDVNVTLPGTSGSSAAPGSGTQ
jgi:hypothetical protein